MQSVANDPPLLWLRCNIKGIKSRPELNGRKGVVLRR